MGDVELSGIVVTLVKLIKKTDHGGSELKAWYDSLSVTDIKTLDEITEIINKLEKREKTLFYIKLTGHILDEVDDDLNSKNIQALIDLKVFLIKIAAGLASLVILIVITNHVITGRHIELQWIKNIWSIASDMFLK